jgi:predicted DNA-binding transcriptional regulator AlpA
MIDLLYADSDLASLLCLSRSWVRKQRMLRRGGLPHALTIDPIMIGSCPRYRSSDIHAWLEAQSEARPTKLGGLDMVTRSGETDRPPPAFPVGSQEPGR